MFYDATTGLYLTKYREYMPSAGRWLNRDPIGIAGGQNIYAYVGGDPTDNYDQYGLMNWPPDLFSQGFVDGVAGFGDGISFGATAAIRKLIGDDAVDYCDGVYGGSRIAGGVYDTILAGAVGAPDVDIPIPNPRNLAVATCLACSLNAGSLQALETAAYEPEMQMVEQLKSFGDAAEDMSSDLRVSEGDQLQNP